MYRVLLHFCFVYTPQWLLFVMKFVTSYNSKLFYINGRSSCCTRSHAGINCYWFYLHLFFFWHRFSFLAYLDVIISTSLVISWTTYERRPRGCLLTTCVKTFCSALNSVKYSKHCGYRRRCIWKPVQLELGWKEPVLSRVSRHFLLHSDDIHRVQVLVLQVAVPAEAQVSWVFIY